jgi:hypothetical protein
MVLVSDVGVDRYQAGAASVAIHVAISTSAGAPCDATKGSSR